MSEQTIQEKIGALLNITICMEDEFVYPITAAAICFIMAGHVKHHLNILTERYL